MAIVWWFQNNSYLCTRNRETTIANKKNIAEIAQLVEHNLAKVRVASSSLVFRSTLAIVRKAQVAEW